ncbi:1-acyl-sn-glycerol-3-phosphate acyltransferase [Bacteroides sp. ET71]|uniref:1-acyl-sn-glycerol-3-phosphate acyltransferase n=1 Tax=Bacteroides sp. ET71 TaxID=2939421 RepID=UPI0020124328|nr:1-acyl-sn-glycerol-3-phosphate acyltransferase [Bacteroides sp. ET71]MCL1617093.1 1-acyl-sn-glycerol-3-phosphate acyltransferase [Bacteroides sp. ET71]
MNEEFDEIRPYYDEELPAVYDELIADPAFRQVVQLALPGIPFEMLAAKMRTCKTKLDFQVSFCYDFLKKIIKETTQGVTLNNEAQGTPDGRAFTYVSNHRDIVLDSGFLSLMLVEQGQDTVEIAIGDNLLIYPWIKKLVRINKSFIVQRALSMRQMLESSARMSRYMHHTICDKHQSIWIAQREGRAKDSNDRTQESILKMFAMAGEGDIVSRLKEMNIVPLAISYEYDPCDFLKAKEFQQKRDNPDYKKTTADDLLNMQTGLMGYKGRVHLCTAECLTKQLDELDRSLPKQELFVRVAELVDKGIFANYRLYPNNYVAADLLEGSNHFAAHYTLEDKQRFSDYVDGQLARIDLPDKDEPFLREKLLLMYANPLRNQLSV